ncbi:cytochrome P450 [Bradyrhizobium erythrophlei]
MFRFVLLDPPAVMPEARITLRPAGGMKMLVRPR